MAFRLKVNKTDINAAKNRLRRKPTVILGRRLEQAGDMILAEVGSGDWFDNPTGKLQGSNTKGRLSRRRATVTLPLLWGVPYGRVLEFGPRVKTWKIRARFGKALRFQVGGSVIFRREVTHHWTPAQKRPHFFPAAKRLAPSIRKLLAKSMKEIVRK